MKKFFKWLLVFLLLIITIIVYARFVGTMGILTKEIAIYNDNLPDEFDGMKIVHFSDLHYNRAITEEKVKAIIKEINSLKPDIVVFTGDLIDVDAELVASDYEFLTEQLSLIETTYGKYSILGNHDYNEMEKVINVFEDSQFKYLDNEYDIIYNHANEKIFIGGINTVSYKLDDTDKTMSYFNDNEDIDYKIILVHEPDITDEIVKDYNVSLILAGHSHNGQVRLPIIGAIVKPEHAKKYYDEHYKVDGTDLYISSGIGVSTINYRLWNRPSINFYRLNKN